MKEVDVCYLVNLIGTHAHKWKQICVQCGLLLGEVEAIGKDLVNILDGDAWCLTVGLNKWCNISSTDGTHYLDPKLDVLVVALRSETVGEGVLADRILKNSGDLPSVKIGIRIIIEQ